MSESKLSKFVPYDAFGVIDSLLDSDFSRFRVGKWIGNGILFQLELEQCFLKPPVTLDKNGQENLYIDRCARLYYSVFRQYFCGPKTAIELKKNGHSIVQYPFHRRDHFSDVQHMIRYWQLDMQTYSIAETTVFLSVYNQLQIFWKSAAAHAKTDDDKRYCFAELEKNLRQIDNTIKWFKPPSLIRPIDKKWWETVAVHFQDVAARRCQFDITKIFKVVLPVKKAPKQANSKSNKRKR